MIYVFYSMITHTHIYIYTRINNYDNNNNYYYCYYYYYILHNIYIYTYIHTYCWPYSLQQVLATLGGLQIWPRFLAPSHWAQRVSSRLRPQALRCAARGRTLRQWGWCHQAWLAGKSTTYRYLYVLMYIYIYIIYHIFIFIYIYHIFIFIYQYVNDIYIYVNYIYIQRQIPIDIYRYVQVLFSRQNVHVQN